METQLTKDILADVLRVGELGSRIVCRPELGAPWGLFFPTENRAFFHIIKKGTCLFYPKQNLNTPLMLNQGDVLFIPRVNNYFIKSSQEVAANYYLDEIKRANEQQNPNIEATTKIICGSYELKSELSIPFFALLPNYIHLSGEELSRYPELGQTVRILIKEESDSRLGSDLIVARLLDIFLVQIIRFWLTHCTQDSSGWLAATLDLEIGRALSLMHSYPERKWNLDNLAKETGISRTKFFTKFNQLVGISPMQYLTNWRIELAKQMLTSSHSSILEIANNVGYESESAFGRVFKKRVQTTPGKYKKHFLKTSQEIL